MLNFMIINIKYNMINLYLHFACKHDFEMVTFTIKKKTFMNKA